MSIQNVYLSIKQGETATKQNRIPITFNETLIGRMWGNDCPDIPFTSQYISRKHALISFDTEENYTIVDLSSKHGTQVNHIFIEKNKPFFLRDGDSITLASGAAVLIFHNLSENFGDTLDMPLVLDKQVNDFNGITVNVVKREILIDGVRIHLTSKDTELFLLLYQKANSAVSYNEIKVNVWPERMTNDIEQPDVGREEINTLIYRLRKKLGKYGQKIVSVPRYGYMFELED
ncbi:FHA domain-containing protein [Gottfriedia acidiceleris]|uniref:FHA domain-containing protein n=1 Tax=Gottfriedia acidiceleris TaxID=371036 RepID=UPI000B430825|nr:FHA domain-containing protein [Gottfriedia acidiceleris]